MKKSNKILLSISSFSAVSLPLVAVSCGGSARFDQTDDGKLKIATGFSENNDQGVALKAIIGAYNDWLNAGTSEEQLEKINKGYLPIEIHFQPNGYSTGTLTTKLGAKEQSDFWNIMVNYPTAASILAQNDMNLSLSNETYESLDIAPAFKNVNDEIGGNLEKKEKWVVPFSRSSEMQSVNKVLLGKLLKELKEIQGVKFGTDENTKKIKEYIDYYTSVSVEGKDGKYVDTEWEKSKASNIEAAKKAIVAMDLTLEDEMFYQYDKLIKFAIAAKKLYPNDLSKPIIGIDSLASVVNVMNAAISKGVKADQYINPSSQHELTGGYDYESFKQSGTKQNILLKEILSVVYKGIETGAVWIGGGGAYGSNLLTKHNMAISIGSTAGYEFTYIKDSTQTTNYIIDPQNTIQSPYELKAKNGAANDGVSLLIKSGKYENKIFSSNLPEGVKPGKYDKQFKSSEAESKVKDEFNKHQNWKLIDADFDGTNIILSKDKKIKLSDDQKSKVVALGEIFANDSKKYTFISNELVKEERLTSEKLLNKEDADWISTPLVKSSADKKSVFIQGPSLVLIHANDREDKATKLFVEWVFKHNIPSLQIKNKGKTENFTNTKAIDAFNLFGNYISPTGTYFKQTTEQLKDKLNPSLLIAFDNFKKIQTDPQNYQAAEDVSSSASDKLRDAIGAAGRFLTGQVSSKKPVKFDDFLNKIINLFI
ncbi:P68 family surface lipoprotein [Mycoplasmopsis arginini]|uniref:P68 family surface lipoprotein n=1 Tax=Mycoplasmopsis arginini TaxID=2094 RepID=UPI002733881F|nr:P80 family lipoprotein [Mycoplasmopsis arginini]MDP4042956.1 P80 family lipoprotein [Mycoplasmopsis arginini]